MYCGRILIVSLTISVTTLTSCKPRESNKAVVLDDQSDQNTTSTPDTLKHLSDRIADGKWKWEIDARKANQNISGVKIKKSEEFFAAPYKSIQACPDSMKVDIEGTPGCLAYDNAMRYNYSNGSISQVPYNHIISQKNGANQPDLDKYMMPGDMIVYFHPENRGGDLGEDGMQWRASHAATIVRKRGKLATADTPSGYAQPFTGVDDTPFHIFRFMPKDANGNDLSDGDAKRYRSMIAKWATLGFDQFEFSSDYESAAPNLVGPESITNFGNEFLKAAITGTSNIPDMYCAWFVYTSLNLAWMHPINEAGLNGMSEGPKVKSSGEFSEIKNGFEYGGSKAMSGYIDNSSRLSGHREFVFPAFTGYELINGLLARLVGADDPKLPPAAFVGFAKNKAGLLQGLSEDPSILDTLRSSPDHVPNYTRAAASEFNAKVPKMMLEMAKMYNDLADAVAGGTKTVEQATTALQNKYKMRSREKNQEFQDISKRWIPPYIFAYIAENYDVRSDDNAKPALAYIGTVIHEKWLKPHGTAGGGEGISPITAIAAEAEDRALDKKMYQIIGRQPSDDMKGYLHFFECLADSERSGCGTAIKRFMTKAESDTLISMANDWKVGNRLPEKEVQLRNRFGLDAVRFRRLLASYWNDPNKAFRPNIFDNASSQIVKASLNFRILMASPIEMAAQQAPKAAYATNERTETMVCVATTGEVVTGNPPSCAHAVVDFGRTTYDLSSESADGSFGTWPKVRISATSGGNTGGGGGGSSVSRRECAKLYTADSSQGRRKVVRSPYEVRRLTSPFNDSITSMVVNPGCTLEVFGAFNFNVNQATGGRLNAGKASYAATTDERKVSLNGETLNDNISSVKCNCASQ